MRTAERDATVAARPAITGPRLDIATVCLSGTLEDKLAAAAGAGFHGVEIFENDLICRLGRRRGRPRREPHPSSHRSRPCMGRQVHITVPTIRFTHR